MTALMRWNWLLAGSAIFLVLLVAVAWIAGGRQPVREIVLPVEVPEEPK